VARPSRSGCRELLRKRWLPVLPHRHDRGRVKTEHGGGRCAKLSTQTMSVSIALKRIPGRLGVNFRYPILMLWTAPPPARECHGCGRC
jgi:hypothetical protein